MKLLKRKNFQSLIYAIFISLPILSILPLTIYFAFNHNAQEYTQNEVKESYEYETNEVNSIEDLVEGRIYHASVDLSQFVNDTYYLTTNKIYNLENSNYQCDYISLRGNVSCNYRTDGRFILINNTTSEWDFVAYNINGQVDFDFIFVSTYRLHNNVVISASDYFGEKNVEVIESEMNPMSAFDNAIGKFVSDNDFGQIDFFTFFSSLFLTSTSMNNLYIHFINWYLNYILYISLAYLLFSVLLWFVNFARRLLEDSQNINIGGF